MLDELKCDGGESRVSNCSHNEIREHDCVNSEDVGVLCRGTVRLCLIVLKQHTIQHRDVGRLKIVGGPPPPPVNRAYATYLSVNEILKLPKLCTPEQIELTLECIVISAATVQLDQQLCCKFILPAGN